MSKTGSGRILLTLVVMSATVMQVLDTTIVNVALPHMEGQLSATPDQISWVLTSYLVSSGIFMPLTGYFTDRLGQKRYLLISILGFVVASALCGLSANLTEIVLFRLLQGVCGAALVPLSQSILVNTYPPEERGKAMAIWGIGVMVGPILGPTLGGYLTQVLDWRWTFYINVPVGVFSFIGAWLVVPDTRKRPRNMDWLGFVLLVCAIAGLQFVLDRGNQDDWFDSRVIQVMTLVSTVGFVGLIYHSLARGREAVFDLRIFKDRNFATSSLVLGVFGLSMYGMLVLQPMMLESLMNYPAFTAGLVMAPRGIVSMVSMFMVGKLINRTGARPLILLGITLGAIGTFVTTGYNLQISPWWVVWPILVQGFGMGMVFVPLAAVAYATLDRAQSAEAAGLYNLIRTIGSSIGISITTTVLTRHAQIAWNQIGENLTPYNPAVSSYLGLLHLHPGAPGSGPALGALLAQQAQMQAMLDAFAFIGWSYVAMMPLVLILGKGKPAGAAAAAAAD